MYHQLTPFGEEQLPPLRPMNYIQVAASAEDGTNWLTIGLQTSIKKKNRNITRLGFSGLIIT